MIDDVIAGERVERFWAAYAAGAPLSIKAYRVMKLGDSAELANELATQVVNGGKRATTCLLRDLADPRRRMPAPGDFKVIVDGTNSPRCIVRILSVDIKRLGDVDEPFALADGGGDCSLEWWRAAHARYFRRQAARAGFAVDYSTEVILERFEVVWPPELADRP